MPRRDPRSGAALPLPLLFTAGVADPAGARAGGIGDPGGEEERQGEGGARSGISTGHEGPLRPGGATLLYSPTSPPPRFRGSGKGRVGEKGRTRGAADH